MQNYYRDKIDNINENAVDCKLFKYKTKTVGKIPAQPVSEGDANQPAVPPLNVDITIPLKY